MTTHEKHAVVVHLEPLRMRVQEHAQSLARAIFAKSCVRKVAKRGADTLATQPTADPEVKRRCKVLLPSHTRPTHHERALLVNLGVRQDELTILHRRAVRAASMHRRGLQHLLVIAHAQEDRVRRTHEAVGRKRYAPNLVAAHPRRVHLGDIETAQRLAEGTEATPENTHNRPAGDQTAARAQRKHLLALVVRKAHRAAAILLTIERHLHTQVRRRCLLGGRASQVAVAAQHSTHDTIRPRTKLATVVGADAEGGAIDGHEGASVARPTRWAQCDHIRIGVDVKRLAASCLNALRNRHFEIRAPRGHACRRHTRELRGADGGRIDEGAAKAALVVQAVFEARPPQVDAGVTEGRAGARAKGRHDRRLTEGILDATARELLLVARHCKGHLLVVHERIGDQIDVAHLVHLVHPACLRPQHKAPVELGRPSRQGEVGDRRDTVDRRGEPGGMVGGSVDLETDEMLAATLKLVCSRPRRLVHRHA